MENLKNLLNAKLDIPIEDWEYLNQRIQEKSVEKKEILTKEGEVESNIYFIQEGMFRLYIELPEKDVTVDFGFPNELICSYTSFITREPSVSNIQSLCSSKVLYISRKDLMDVYSNTQTGEAIGRVFTEEFFLYKSKRELSFMKESPTERYLKMFEEQPQLIQDIPQIYLASYIGITPQALSRIRAKIFQK